MISMVLGGGGLAWAEALPIQSVPTPTVTSSSPSTSVSSEEGNLSPIPSASVPIEGPTAVFFGRKVDAIHIRGLKRIEKEAVLNKLATKLGSTATADQIRSDIHALFLMGFFDDIAVSAMDASKGGIELIYDVRERPVIAKVDFEGNDQISTSDLKDVIKLKEWSILDINKVKEDVALIQKHYEDKGYYLAKVTYVVETLRPDEVSLTFKINDYQKVQIKKITFLNNKKFSDSQLKSQLAETREGGFFSFITSSGNFKESAFKQDLQRLVYWYLEHGYLKFRYENPSVTVSDDKKWLYISIYVEEGDQYKIGTTDFSGDLLYTTQELQKDLVQAPGDVFSVSRRNQDIQNLTEKYQDLGYAFVNVIPKMHFHEDTKTVDFEYSFEKGNLAYFGEINVLGNTKTYDKVIRRELKIREGELFSGSKLRISKENVERLGFFAPGEVAFNTKSPPGKTNVVDLDISIKERSTGTITVGAGWGSANGFFFTSQISEINLFGRGQSLNFAMQVAPGSPQQSFNLGFNEPYLFDTVWSAGFDVYWVKVPIPYAYTLEKKGFDFRLGHPIFDYTYGYITTKFEDLDDLNYTSIGVPLSGDLFNQASAADTGYLSSVTFSVIRDKRNNRFETTAGNYQSASFEVSGWPGDMTFYKWDLDSRIYQKVTGDLVFRNNTELAQIGAYGSRPLPPAQKFYLGGPNDMRGFPFFTLGPQGPSSDLNNPLRPVGGTVKALSMFEFEYPILKEAGIKAVAFMDFGNIWDSFPAGLFGSLRSDAGFGIRWFSPIGPLRFEWGYPLNRQPNESPSQFNFFIGPPF
jgi:outer membrane protein insertion porin family